MVAARLAAMSPRERLATARLYLVCDARPLDWSACRAARRRRPRAAARQDARRRRARGAPHARSGRPPTRPARCSSSTTGRTSWRRAAPTGCTSARTTTPPAEARASVGPERIVGRSTHAPEQADAAVADRDVDYLAVGPGPRDADQAGPPGRGPGATSSTPRARRRKPWFAIGGLDAGDARRRRSTAARARIVVVRAITDAADPEAAAAPARRAATRSTLAARA